MSKLGYWIILIYLALIFFASLPLMRKSAPVRGYSFSQYIDYKIRMLKIKVESKLLAERMYEQINYWKNQPKPEPKVIEQPFINRG